MSDNDESLKFMVGDDAADPTPLPGLEVEPDSAETEQPRYLIVTRFVGLVEYLNRRGIVGPVVNEITPTNEHLLVGRHVFGTRISLFHAAQADTVTEVRVSGLSELERHYGLSADELEQRDVTQITYEAKRLVTLWPDR